MLGLCAVPAICRGVPDPSVDPPLKPAWLHQYRESVICLAFSPDGKTLATGVAPCQVPWRRAIVERFVPAGDELLAVVSDGRLLAAPRDTLRWRHALADAPPVLAAAELAL